MNTPWREMLALALQSVVREDVDAGSASTTLVDLPTHRLLLVDPSCRTMRVQYNSRQWRIAPKEPLRLPDGASATDISAYLYLLGCDSSGYLRQQAVRFAAEHPSPTTVALALIRCADWVQPVRIEAEAALRAMLTRKPDLVFDQIELIARLLGHERFMEHAWPDIIAPALQSPEYAEARWRALHAGSGRQRMLIVETIQAAEPENINKLILSCLRSRDPVPARWAMQQLAKKPARDAAFDDAISVAMRHSNLGIVLQAMRLRALHGVFGIETMILDSLCSPFFSVRSLAAHLASQRGIDALQYWRAAIGDPAHPGARHALASLAERAKPEDFERIEPWTRHSIAETRRHALTGLVNADADRSAPFLLRALASDSAKEVRQALKLGQRVTRFHSRTNLVQAYQASAHLHARFQIVQALRALWPWDQLDALLDCFSASHDPQDPALLDALRHWHGALIGKLDPQRKSGLRERIARKRNSVAAVDWDRIDAILATA